MLELLRISSYAIIDQLDVEFGSGLTTLTGETGAGKSILLGALRLVLGDRATSEVVRTGSSRATVEAVFRASDKRVASWINEANFSEDESDPQVLVRREILATGTSRNFINNRSATLGQLRELGSMLVDLHGQNDHTALILPANQLRLLDCYGDYAAASGAYRKAYYDYRDAATDLRALLTDSAEAERRKAFLEFQVEEIQKAEIQQGEDDALEAERRRLMNAGRLGAACQAVCDLLYEGEQSEVPVSAQLATVQKALVELVQLDRSQEPLLKDAEALRFAVEDLCEKVRDYAATVQADPQRQAFVEDRLHLLRGLKKKYGPTLEDVVANGDQLNGELQRILNRDEELAQSRTRYEKAYAEVKEAAKALHASREKAATQFERSVQKEMRELELPKAVFNIRLLSSLPDQALPDAEQPGTLLEHLTTSGADSVEFMASLNPGEEPKAMRKVASGGEISRIMLAIKSVLAGRDAVPTLIFDEIDVGISGQAAARVGEKLGALSRSHQVLCITHLPQIAARGDRHLVVEKFSTRDHTTTAVRAVTDSERADALARMLSGAEADETSLRYAEKLLEKR